MYKLCPLGGWEEMNEDEDTFETVSYYGIPLEQVRTDRQAIVKDNINDFTKANNGEECPMEFITKLIYL